MAWRLVIFIIISGHYSRLSAILTQQCWPGLYPTMCPSYSLPGPCFFICSCLTTLASGSHLRPALSAQKSYLNFLAQLLAVQLFIKPIRRCFRQVRKDRETSSNSILKDYPSKHAHILTCTPHCRDTYTTE